MLPKVQSLPQITLGLLTLSVWLFCFKSFSVYLQQQEQIDLVLQKHDAYLSKSFFFSRSI
jgi:hypothetical protein